jgi:hypothetical protein
MNECSPVRVLKVERRSCAFESKSLGLDGVFVSDSLVDMELIAVSESLSTS